MRVRMRAKPARGHSRELVDRNLGPVPSFRSWRHQRSHVGVSDVLLRNERRPSVLVLLILVAFDVIEDDFNSVVTHFDRVLNDQGVDLTALKTFDKPWCGIESDELDFAGPLILLENLH